MKLYIYITDIRKYLKGEYSGVFALYPNNDVGAPEWVLAGSVELDLDVDNQKITQKAQDILDGAIDVTKKEALAKVEILEREKQELLAISYSEKES